MKFPKLPGRSIANPVRVFLLAAWALISLTGFCAAAGPFLGQPTTEPPEEKSPADKKVPVNPEGGFPYAPLVFTEDMWGNLLQGQNAYLIMLGEVEQELTRTIHVFADGGFFLMQTYFSRPNPAFVISGKPTLLMPSPKFEFTMNVAPVVNLGALNEDGWGVRGTWQQLDEHVAIPRFPSNDATAKTTVSSVPVFDVPGFTSPGTLGKQLGIVKDKVNFSDHLRMTVFDVEVIKEFRRDPWTLLAGGGVGYLYLSQTYDAFRINTGTVTKVKGLGKAITTTTLNLVEDSDRVDSGRNFGGVGPYGSTELRYRVGRFPLWLFANANGTILFGREEIESFESTKENLQTTVKKGKTSTTTKLVTTTLVDGTTAADKTLPMADFEVGADMAIPYGRFLILLRAGLAEEIIFDGGNATSTSGNPGFFGLRFTAGLNF